MDIRPEVEADKKRLNEFFEDHPNFEPVEVLDLDNLRQSAIHVADEPVLVVYSGHGQLGSRSSTNLSDFPSSELCVKQGGFGVDRLMQWLAERRPSWAVVVLNACESAHVDPSLAAPVPVSVISASTSPTTASSPPQSKYDGSALIGAMLDTFEVAAKERRSSAQAAASEDACHPSLGMPAESPDGNCDGLLDDEELFEILEGTLRQQSRQSWTQSVGYVGAVPKLRRNSSSPLPVLPVHSSYRCTKVPELLEAAQAAAPALVHAIEQERCALAQGRLPTQGFDKFLLQRDDDYVDCSARASKEPEVTNVCTTLQKHLHPALVHPGHIENQALACLGRLPLTFRVYDFRLEEDWVKVVDRSDDGIVAVRRQHNLLQSIPQRDGEVAFGVERVERRFRSSVCLDDLTRAGAVAVPCASSTGQCFEFESANGSQKVRTMENCRENQ